VDDGGGTELIASQDEPHGEEPEIAHVPADRQLPADFDATQEAGHLYIRPPGGGPTHTTHPHITRTYMQDAAPKKSGNPNQPPAPTQRGATTAVMGDDWFAW
jgi:hypothetical protein